MNKINKVLCKLSINTCIISPEYSLVMPIESYDSSKLNSITHRLYNKNNILLVIEEMCLGIFLSIYEASKLPFLERIIKNDTELQTSTKYFHKKYGKFSSKKDDHTGCLMIKIGSEWDIINLWSYHKLLNIHTWIHHVTPMSNIDTEYQTEIRGTPQDIMDIEFLTTMGYLFS